MRDVQAKLSEKPPALENKSTVLVVTDDQVKSLRLVTYHFPLVLGQRNNC